MYLLNVTHLNEKKGFSTKLQNMKQYNEDSFFLLYELIFCSNNNRL